MTTETLTSYAASQILIELILEKGMFPENLERQAGVSLAKIKDPDVRIPMKSFFKLWQLAIDLTGDRALALHLREKVGLQHVHFVVALAQHSSNLLEAAYHFSRYGKLISATDKFDVLEKDRRIKIIYTNILPDYQSRWIAEHHFSLTLDIARSLTKSDFNPVKVHFQHKDPGYVDAYDKAFRAPILFQQSENMIVYQKSDFLKPIASRDPNIQTALQNYAETSLKKQNETETLQGKVRKYIINHLSDGELNIKNTAKAMNMDSSTLYRQLKKDGATFRGLILKIRQESAKNYLRQDLTSSQITYLLGFSEPAAFQHSFKRWFGVSPGEYRKSY
jgi:AraC-like DNA-binding protein